MHVILTHDQADFDALAAMLGAHLLNEQAVPVLPRRLNRNARAFINLYGSNLPFIEQRDLSGEPIESVTLVDTQSLITLKGLTNRTKVHVVDHHAVRPDLSPSWTISQDKVGAVTTLMVEQLREHDGALDRVHATLLLLGIYEDTGSLTYASTTSRDARAVAFLLEAGASLKVAADFLNPPLSAPQRELYNRLLVNAETLHIQDQTIIVSAARGDDMNEEISSVAHKLRDLLDPDALFLLVKIGEGVRMVARSTSDQVDVSAVAACFGGGGHDRAAAALVRTADHAPEEEKERLLADTTQRLLDILPAHVRPSITVGQIMSRRPKLLSARTSAQEAQTLMQRFGYEGFPVIEDNRVVGLLTRRAVDRAIAHKLNLPAASLMEAGEITVTAQDSLDTLQKRMASSGWGQIPVVNPETGKVTGIVTRTDLLKTLAGSEAQAGGMQNYAARLKAFLPAGRLAFLQVIASEAARLRLPIYIVGGFVRDLLLERPSYDLDIVVEGDALTLAHGLQERFGGHVTGHSRFGTAKWQIDEIRNSLLETLQAGTVEDLPESLDLISSRTEFYTHPTALPTVERGSIKLDLHRRDFTINTMAIRLDGHHFGDLYDYWGGLHDLREGAVRVLHSLSFVDDPTRLLRAVRFEQRFGFRIEDRTMQLVNEALPLLGKVTGTRLKHEFDLIFSEERAPEMMTRLDELGILTSIHPDLKWNTEQTRQLRFLLAAEPAEEWELPESVGPLPRRRALGYLVWMQNLAETVLPEISELLRFPRHLADDLLDLIRLKRDLPELVPASLTEIVTRLEDVSRLDLYVLFCASDSDSIREMIQTYIQKWSHLHPFTDGNALRSLGVPPGPQYRKILEILRAAWLDGKIGSQAEEEAFLRTLLHTGIQEN